MGIALLLVLLAISACDVGPVPSSGRVASVTIMAGGAVSGSISPLAFQGSFADVTSISVQAHNGAALLDSAALSDTGSGWNGTLFSLPVGPTLTFSAEGFNVSAVKIFGGSLLAAVVEGGNQISISMLPLEDGTGFPVPSVTGIVLPGQIDASVRVSVTILVSGEPGGSLDYAIVSGGGAFSVLSGSVSLDGSGDGSFSVDFTAPVAAGTYSHTVTVTNVQNVSTTTTFGTVVVMSRCIVGMSQLDNCSLAP